MYRVSALQQPYEFLAQQRGSALAAMHQQNLAGREGLCIEREIALLRQKALCEQGWQNADGQPLLHKRDNGGGDTHGVVGQKRDPLFGKPCVPRSVLRGSETLRGRVSERRTLPLWDLGREVLPKNAESLRSSDALMRVAVPRRRGPAGLRNLFLLLSELWLVHPALRTLCVYEVGVVSLPSACFACF